MPRTRQAMKQRRPAATDDGMNDDAVLVDEPQLLERSRDERVRVDRCPPVRGIRWTVRGRGSEVSVRSRMGPGRTNRGGSPVTTGKWALSAACKGQLTRFGTTVGTGCSCGSRNS